MRSGLIVGLILLTSAFWLQAQEGIPGADVWIPVDTYPPTITGCLVRAGFYYVVVGGDGTVYNLARCTTGLAHFVGHEVEITGKPTLITLDTTEVWEASTVQELPALQVKSVKELSGSCTPQQR